MDLEKAREKIDIIDGKLLSLFIERQEISKEIGQYKAKNGLPVSVPEREHELLQNIAKKAGTEYEEYATSLYSTILSLSRSLQYRQIELFNGDKNIILIGMPGCGKSTVGKIIAEKLNLKFIDTDCEIFRSEHRSITDIINEHGESFFRELEHREIKKAVKNTDCVIAVGGGAITYEKNFAPMHENSTVFFLDRDIHTLPLTGRPISQKEGIDKLYRERLPLYLSWKSEGCHIKCTDSPLTTAQMVIERLKSFSTN